MAGSWIREMVKLEVTWSFVIFFNKIKNLGDQDDFKYYWHDDRESLKSILE